MKHEWNELITVQSMTRVTALINQYNLKYFSTTKASFGDTDWYRCGLVKRSSHNECPVKAKIVKLNDRKDYTLWYTTWEHHHPDKNALKMPEKYREEIVRQTQSKVKPHLLLKSLNDRFGDEFPVNIRQIRYERKKVTSAEPIVNHGELVNWIRSKKVVPTNMDQTFCLSFLHDPKSGKFNAVFSTLRCLSFAKTSKWGADSTYKLVWQNYPINIVGAFDAAGKVHMLATSISTNETSDDWGFIFTAISTAGKRYHKFDVRPTHLMTDAAMAMKNGFLASFPYVDGTIFDFMCSFHTKKALLNAKYRSKENKDGILRDFDVMQLCQSKEIFQHVLKLFILKWQKREPAFIQYFKIEWIRKNPHWYAAAELKAPNTNNAMEGFNLSLKRDHTLRERQPLTQFSGIFIDFISYKSQMYTRSQEKKNFTLHH